MAISCYCHHPCTAPMRSSIWGATGGTGGQGPQIGWWTRLTGRKEGRNHFQGSFLPASVKRRWNGVKPSGKAGFGVNPFPYIITCFPRHLVAKPCFPRHLNNMIDGENYTWVYLCSVQLPSCLWCEFDIAHDLSEDRVSGTELSVQCYLKASWVLTHLVLFCPLCAVLGPVFSPWILVLYDAAGIKASSKWFKVDF